MKKSRKKAILTCLDCGKIITGGSHLARHVKEEHQYSSYDEYKIKHNLIKTNNQLLCEGAVDCKLCGLISHDLTSHITRTHKIPIQEYKNRYGNIRSEQYLNSQSERILGDKNPAYEHGGKFSPFSDKFIYADTMNKEELCKKVSESNKNNGNNDKTISYWVKKGFTEEEAKENISNIQTTFSLEICVEKYGEEEGKKRWLDRQEKWQDSCKKSKLGNFSRISQQLFWKIIEKLNKTDSIFFAQLDENKNPDFSGNNNEYRLKLTSKILIPDFIDINTKKIIEFDGTYWHGKHIIRYTNKLREEDRDTALISDGYKVLHIKEEDYRNNPQECVLKCVDFLNG
jgi:hypothetical protein